MYEYASPFVGDLARQLKRGPVRLRPTQLLNVEFLLSVVEPGKAYPRDFVTHALTGFRPRAGGDPADAPLIDGDVLRGDLVSLAEDISDDAAIPVGNWPDALYNVNELAERFDVSTKTIFRWRRRGLVGWKFRYPDRRMRLAFPDRCVRRFVAEHADLVQRGSHFSQLSPAERDTIIARARVIVESGERTVNAVARLIAAESGRAVETIRLILKHFDEAHPKAGIFNRSALRSGADEQRLAIWEAYVDGASVEALAARFGRPFAWVYACVTQMRARELEQRKIEFMPCPDFEAPDADERILNAPALRHPHSVDAVAAKRIPADLPPYLQQLFRIPLLSTEGEQALFRKLNYLRFKADRLRQALDPETATAVELDRIEALLADAAEVKNQITQANLRLVVSIAKRHASFNGDFFETVSDGNISLMRAVDRFDFTRGFKFSTYASWAVIRNYARTVPDQKHHLERYQTGREELLEIVPGPRFDEAEDDFVPAARNLLERMLDTLDERERSILRQRFGLDGGGEPQTLEQIGKRFGVSKERVRQLEARAMTKLRGDFAADARVLLGA